MRRYPFILSLVIGALLASACSDDEIAGLPTFADTAIEFGAPSVGVEVGTRGPVNQLPDGASFGVFGYCLAQTSPSDQTLNTASGNQVWDYKKQLCRPEVFYNQQVTYNQGVCTYTPPEQWYAPTDYNYSFFAYYPYGNTFQGNTFFTTSTTATTLGAPKVEFSIPFDSTDETTPLDDSKVPDAMVAQSIDVTRNTGQVQLNFLHILTGLNFQVNNYNVDENGNPGNPVTIHSLKLRGKFYKSVQINFDQGYDFPDETFHGTYTILDDSDKDVTVNGLESVSKIGDKTLLLVSNLNKTSTDDGYLGQLSLDIVYSFGDSQRRSRSFPRPENFLPSGGTIYTAQLNFIGDSFVLNFIVDNNQQWEDGGDSDITFE